LQTNLEISKQVWPSLQTLPTMHMQYSKTFLDVALEEHHS